MAALPERGGDTLGALDRANGLVGNIADYDRNRALVGPGVEGEFRQRVAGDASSQ